MDSNLKLIVLLVGGTLFVLAVRRWLAINPLRKVRGPPSPGWLLGYVRAMDHQPKVGYLDAKHMSEYGAVFRVMCPLGKHALQIADPKALQYILHKSGYRFQKSVVYRTVSSEVTGNGILAAHGQSHARQRKIMNPAFTSAELRSFLPTFRSSAQKLSQKWQDMLQTEPDAGKRLNVLAWLTRCTLDIIGEVGFDVQLGAMDNKLNSVMAAYKDMFADSIAYPSAFTILFRALWCYIPAPLLKYVKYMPGKDHARLRRTLKLVSAYSKSLIDEKTEAILAGEGEKKKDIISILVRANAAEEPKERLTDEEMIAQMASFLLAGHETTASSTSWLLYELARHPTYQQKMREEIKAARACAAARGSGEQEFTMNDLDSMTHCLAAIKEALRLYPSVYTTERQATRDDVLPLAYPLTTTTGETLTEIPIPKGTSCRLSIWGYNRLPQIWGPDANEFNPMRFIQQETFGETYVGMTSNLMTFGAGVQGCIGWRFAMIEIQAVLVELIEKFEFSMPDRPAVFCFPAGLMTPFDAMEMHLGSQMPLRVSLVQ